MHMPCVNNCPWIELGQRSSLYMVSDVSEAFAALRKTVIRVRMIDLTLQPALLAVILPRVAMATFCLITLPHTILSRVLHGTVIHICATVVLLRERTIAIVERGRSC